MKIWRKSAGFAMWVLPVRKKSFIFPVRTRACCSARRSITALPVFWRRSTPLWWRWSKARLPRRRRPCVSVICSSKMHICSRNMARQACAPRYRRDIRPVTAALPTVLERAALHALPGSALLWEAVFPRFRRAARPPFRERRAAEPIVRETWWSIKFSAAARC